MTNTIFIKTYSNNRDEKVAAGTILPGMLVELDSSGLVQAQSTAKAQPAMAFAVESDIQGDPITTAYVSTERVAIMHALPGDEINAVITTGEDLVIGDFLEATGDGKLREETDGVRIAVASEDTIATGLTSKGDVDAATTTTLPTCTYDNGTLGVGATLTGDATGALIAQDSVTLANGEILLVKDQAAGLQNGIYDVTNKGVTEVVATISDVITFGAPSDGDTVVFTGLPGGSPVTFTKQAAAAGNDFLLIADLTALINSETDLSATDNGTVITITVDTAGVAMNSAVVSGTGSYSALNLTFSGGIDGVAYILTRATNQDTTLEFVDTYVSITGGSTLINTRYTCSNATAPTVGTTAITYAAFASVANQHYRVIVL